MKRRRVVFTPDAATDLETIYDLIADAAGPTVAAGYDQRLRNFCRSLELFAERGSRRDDIRPGLRVVGFERRASVAFFVEGDSVVILRLFYGGRNWTNTLR